jgi:acetoin utilization deacetylase AcuC-like enzyme
MLLFVLEGGYDAAGLARSVKAVITTMKGNPAFEYVRKGEPCPGVVEVVTNVKRVLGPFRGKL